MLGILSSTQTIEIEKKENKYIDDASYAYSMIVLILALTLQIPDSHYDRKNA